ARRESVTPSRRGPGDCGCELSGGLPRQGWVVRWETGVVRVDSSVRSFARRAPPQPDFAQPSTVQITEHVAGKKARGNAPYHDPFGQFVSVRAGATEASVHGTAIRGCEPVTDRSHGGRNCQAGELGATVRVVPAEPQSPVLRVSS